MIDKEKATMAVGDEGFRLYERIVDLLEKFGTLGSIGRIGGKLSIFYRIEGKGYVYIDIYNDGVDMQLGTKSYVNIPYDKSLAQLQNFLRD